MNRIRAAFDQGRMPRIDVVNHATVPLGFELPKLVAALQAYNDKHFSPVWGTPCKLRVSKSVRRDGWAIVLADDPDVENALGYHGVTEYGFPLCYVFVRLLQEIGGSVSVTASHELAEVLVDPAINLWAEHPDGSMWAYETADAVEHESEAFPVNGFPMSNFVYPAYFEGFRKPGSAKFDHQRLVKKPFEIRPGGYSLVKVGSEYEFRFGSRAARAAFKREDRRGHRATLRQDRKGAA